jgi:hypothetical protein
MRLRLVNGASDINRAGHWNIGLPTLGPDRDFGGTWVVAVLLFQRLLKRSNIHGNLILSIFRRPSQLNLTC